jgi:hypothetical protein
MITLSRVKQATKEFVKVLRYGRSDVVTADQYLPFGIDSKPIQDMIAARGKTRNSAEPIIFGYLIESEKTEEGEIRLYSSDSSGNEKVYVYIKKDGTIEIGGDTDNLVKYTPLNTAMNQLALDINAELVKISAGITTAGGAYTPEPISIDISKSKVDEIKVS